MRREKSCMILVPRNATAARQLNVVKRTCNGTELCNGAFEKKKSEVHFI